MQKKKDFSVTKNKIVKRPTLACVKFV